jgi:glycosyltransferase involved in cell wall biosynthesis
MSQESDKPLVSIGFPVFNGAPTIKRAIEALLKQSYSNIELIISSNGSTDATKSIIESIQVKDSRIRFLNSDVNRGSIWNFNQVLLASRGKYFMWAAHDDLHHLTFVEQCVQKMEQDENAVLCSPKIQFIDQNTNAVMAASTLETFKGTFEVVPHFREALWRFPAASMYGLYRLDQIRSISLPSIMGGDLVFIYEVSLRGKFVSVDEVLFSRIVRSNWNTTNQDFMTFFGKSTKPIFYLPFVLVSYHILLVVSRFKCSLQVKLRLMNASINFILKSLMQKVTIKLLKFFLPRKCSQQIRLTFYRRFLANPNVEIVDSKRYLERIIKPQIEIRD